MIINAKEFITEEDQKDLIVIRREIHMHPELGRELPNTCAVVKRELDKAGIPYTEKYCVSSVVGYINYGEDPENAPALGEEGHVFTIALRADMDALPVNEIADVPFQSRIPGKMHACGHDTHTAMLIIAARALKRAADEGKLRARIKLLFQPNEEGEDSGAFDMVDNGCLADVDFVYGQHVQPSMKTGTIGYNYGPVMASCHVHNITFHGKSAHSTAPEDAHDALAMALKAANDIYMMEARELSPFEKHVISICYLHSGTAHNVIPDTAEMKINVRTYNDDVDDFITRKIKEISEHSAAELGGTADVTDILSAYVLNNDKLAVDNGLKAAVNLVGEDNVSEFPVKLSSEDFSGYTKVRPGAFLRLGTGNEEKGTCVVAHRADFKVDEDALIIGAELLTQIGLEADENGKGQLQ